VDLVGCVETIRRHVPAAMVVYAFGSVATGEDMRDSDVDLAVLASRPIDSVERWTLQETLASEVHRSVDLVDLRRASTVMRAQVIANGRVLWEADPDARARFEATAFSAYARLNEERRGILEDVRSRGTVHG
jgi:predicted nucleotidyltransferase